jgi:Tol biopolymer transport system component
MAVSPAQTKRMTKLHWRARTLLMLPALVAWACGSVEPSLGPSPSSSGASQASNGLTPGSPATTSPTLAPLPSVLPQSTLTGRLLFDNFDDIFVLDLPTGSLRRLTSDPGQEINAVWSPDGQKIAYRSNRDGRDDIWLMDADGGNRRNLTHTPDRDEYGATWSPDGKWLAFNASQPGLRGPLQLVVLRPDGTGRHVLRTAYAEFPDWSPNGRQLAFASMLPGGLGLNPDYDIRVVNADGTGEHALGTTPNVHEMYPRWSPDGARLAFMAGPVGVDSTTVWIMRADGAQRKEITSGNSALPGWSPDGRYIAFVRAGEQNELLVVRPDGSGLIELGLRSLSGLGFPSWAR